MVNGLRFILDMCFSAQRALRLKATLAQTRIHMVLYCFKCFLPIMHKLTQYFSQGHFNMLTGGAEDQTPDLPPSSEWTTHSIS